MHIEHWRHGRRVSCEGGLYSGGQTENARRQCWSSEPTCNVGCMSPAVSMDRDLTFLAGTPWILVDLSWDTMSWDTKKQRILMDLGGTPWTQQPCSPLGCRADELHEACRAGPKQASIPNQRKIEQFRQLKSNVFCDMQVLGTGQKSWLPQNPATQQFWIPDLQSRPANLFRHSARRKALPVVSPYVRGATTTARDVMTASWPADLTEPKGSLSSLDAMMRCRFFCSPAPLETQFPNFNACSSMLAILICLNIEQSYQKSSQ